MAFSTVELKYCIIFINLACYQNANPKQEAENVAILSTHDICS